MPHEYIICCEIKRHSTSERERDLLFYLPAMWKTWLAKKKRKAAPVHRPIAAAVDVLIQVERSYIFPGETITERESRRDDLMGGARGLLLLPLPFICFLAHLLLDIERGQVSLFLSQSLSLYIYFISVVDVCRTNHDT